MRLAVHLPLSFASSENTLAGCSRRESIPEAKPGCGVRSSLHPSPRVAITACSPTLNPTFSRFERGVVMAGHGVRRRHGGPAAASVPLCRAEAGGDRTGGGAGAPALQPGWRRLARGLVRGGARGRAGALVLELLLRPSVRPSVPSP
ncbi:hypothetical protein U9M48_004342 [Paspalum notatum var. saurae]|uniref:Uncharacterized protein n=1 Tax=Paspalum notatum var. saurae TaxID=547442 RepID=A0AAQ3SER3_PASNO